MCSYRALPPLRDSGCIVLTGYGRAFAAGADILEMKDKSYFEMSTKDKIKLWERIGDIKIPIIAAVNVCQCMLFVLHDSPAEFAVDTGLCSGWWLRDCHDVRHHHR